MPKNLQVTNPNPPVTLDTYRDIDGKFAVVGDNIRIVNKVTGVEIPTDEPLFLLRARDHLALETLYRYLELATQDGCAESHIKGIVMRIQQFVEFRLLNPDRMKQPGITGHIDLEPVSSTAPTPIPNEAMD